MKDLLLDMRVCETWKQAIDNSKKLQKDLFFLADGKPQPLHKIEWYDANSRYICQGDEIKS